ncbi:uncharacterized protein BO66DRAFT_183871 [Aspergillus aculeatinus CBS 121060]|uniref:Uncharacterized protein n=1 Tax=Aspergillus aculeatinus CBS 121060 TaxID=1448322 RepID=A0ACD1GYB8_9EURO|nr:hypothetical protein BO66DRAFT_183871 [Aspergillus aculeatinus CBS 121060]RAH66341.1 hypothetical protein BO66DRAFT_183871 [Aspergillus aculeatinus CBS 121060]
MATPLKVLSPDDNVVKWFEEESIPYAYFHTPVAELYWLVSTNRHTNMPVKFLISEDLIDQACEILTRHGLVACPYGDDCQLTRSLAQIPSSADHYHAALPADADAQGQQPNPDAMEVDQTQLTQPQDPDAMDLDEDIPSFPPPGSAGAPNDAYGLTILLYPQEDLFWFFSTPPRRTELENSYSYIESREPIICRLWNCPVVTYTQRTWAETVLINLSRDLATRAGVPQAYWHAELKHIAMFWYNDHPSAYQNRDSQVDLHPRNMIKPYSTILSLFREALWFYDQDGFSDAVKAEFREMFDELDLMGLFPPGPGLRVDPCTDHTFTGHGPIPAYLAPSVAGIRRDFQSRRDGSG